VAVHGLQGGNNERLFRQHAILDMQQMNLHASAATGLSDRFLRGFERLG